MHATSNDHNALAPDVKLCAICEQEPGTIDAIDCDRPARVCADCFAIYGDGDEEEGA